MGGGRGGSVREYVFYVFFQLKNMTFYVFEITYQKSLKTAKVQSSIRKNEFVYFCSVIAVIQFPAPILSHF